jgi:hypothetical protein
MELWQSCNRIGVLREFYEETDKVLFCDNKIPNAKLNLSNDTEKRGAVRLG